jgi:hypothetical protein
MSLVRCYGPSSEIIPLGYLQMKMAPRWQRLPSQEIDEVGPTLANYKITVEA